MLRQKSCFTSQSSRPCQEGPSLTDNAWTEGTGIASVPQEAENAKVYEKTGVNCSSVAWGSSISFSDMTLGLQCNNWD